MEYQNIDFKVTESGIGILTMNRPAVMNALNYATFSELDQLLESIAQNELKGKGLIITGSGKAFVAGADLSEIKDDGIEENRRYSQTAQSLFDKLAELPIPTIAAVNGYALGGGCELAMACDIRFAGERAKFGQPEVDLGVIPCFGGTQRLPRLIGAGLAKELIFSGRRVDAQEAAAIGLVNRVVPQEELLDQSIEFMELMLTKSPTAIRYAKVAINHGQDMTLRDGLELEKDLSAICYGLPDKAEGVQAFFEKRKPNF